MKNGVATLPNIYVSKEKQTYLASVMDLYSRKIIGYAYGKTMDTSLVIKAKIYFILI